MALKELKESMSFSLLSRIGQAGGLLTCFLALLLSGLLLFGCAPASPGSGHQATEMSEPLLLLGDGGADWL